MGWVKAVAVKPCTRSPPRKINAMSPSTLHTPCRRHTLTPTHAASTSHGRHVIGAAAARVDCVAAQSGLAPSVAAGYASCGDGVAFGASTRLLGAGASRLPRSILFGDKLSPLGVLSYLTAASYACVQQEEEEGANAPLRGAQIAGPRRESEVATAELERLVKEQQGTIAVMDVRLKKLEAQLLALRSSVTAGAPPAPEKQREHPVVRAALVVAAFFIMWLAPRAVRSAIAAVARSAAYALPLLAPVLLARLMPRAVRAAAAELLCLQSAARSLISLFSGASTAAARVARAREAEAAARALVAQRAALLQEAEARDAAARARDQALLRRVVRIGGALAVAATVAMMDGGLYLAPLSQRLLRAAAAALGPLAAALYSAGAALITAAAAAMPGMAAWVWDLVTLLADAGGRQQGMLPSFPGQGGSAKGP